MTVKTDHGSFEVRDLTFKDRRELHKLEVGSVDSQSDIKMDKFLVVLEWVMNFAFDNPEEHLGQFNDNIIDEILIAIYNAYKEPSKKK
tara:strand:- start:2867 stop:3130 length:264 start_codon:yes stop_codon:yes gene_type:complete